MSRTATLKDISKVSGVSYRTVSEVLSGRESGEKYYYSNKAKETVLKTAKELGYRKNRSARNTVHKRHGTIAVVIDSLFTIRMVMFNSMSKAAADNDLLLVIDRIDGDNILPRSLSEDMCDGVILTGINAGKLGKKYEQLGVPAVYLHTDNPETPGAVSVDEYHGTEMIVNALAEAGRKQIVLYFSQSTYKSSLIRREAFNYLSEQAGMKEPVLVEHYRSRYTYEFFLKHLEENSGIDAIIIDEKNLIKACNACTAAGKEIGRDISVICYGEQRGIAGSFHPKIDSLMIHNFDTGALVIDTLVRTIKGETVPAQKIQYEWHEGNSI